MHQADRSYIPAAGHDWTLPLYDPLVKLMGGDKARRLLIEQAALRPGHRVLDVGCGTGSLATLVKRLHPDVEVVGLDPDPKVLARARRKAEGEAVVVQLDPGFGDQLPYADAVFDRVLSSFMFHHLRGEEKASTLREARRVLKPGGFLLLLDFAGPEYGARRPLVRRLYASPVLRDNSEARMPTLLREAGFEEVTRRSRGALLWGQLPYCCYEARAAG